MFLLYESLRSNKISMEGGVYSIRAKPEVYAIAVREVIPDSLRPYPRALDKREYLVIIRDYFC